VSVRLMSAVWDLDLPPGEKLVLLALADQANDEGRQCWPAVSTIAHKSGQGERTVRRALSDLEAKGHLTRGHRDGASTQYHVHPGQSGTPAKLAPLPKTTETPAKLAPKTPITTKSSTKASPSSRARPAVAKVLHFRLPDDWKPSRFADGTVAREIIDRRGQEWARAALESFRAWAANADDKNGAGRKLNWQAAWVKWVIEQDKRDGRTNGMARTGQPGGGSSGNGLIDAIRESRANREAVPWDAGDPRGMQIVAGLG